MEKFVVEIKTEKIQERINQIIDDTVSTALSEQSANIKEVIKKCFEVGYFEKKTNQFSANIDWAIEFGVRQGVEKALNEMGFIDLVAEEVKRQLNTGTFIQELAEDKVRQSLGLLYKYKKIDNEE